MGMPDQPERSESFQPGQSVGKFYLVQLIGEGGTSRIFKALQQPISRVVALKIPSFPQSGGILTPDEFLAEATLMARLDHPNIARIHDFGVEDGKAFISMEHVEGSNLLELVSRRHEAGAPLPASAVMSLALQVLEGLLHAHSRDVLHQDLSPANVLVARTGAAKLIDFGMAGKAHLAKGGNVVGTPAFLSPEHVAGKPATARSDLFSFGSLIYFAARGEPLFDPGENGSRLREAFQEIEKARWQPPLDRLRTLPAALSRLVRAALEGGDPEAMLRDLRGLWTQAEGGTRPEDALRRELREDAGGAGVDPPATEKEIREAYLKLRSEGRHREAVALLERALKSQPDNPILRDLLATPPARAKSAPVTVEVATPGAAAAGGKGSRAPWALAAGALALIALAATALTVGGGAEPEPHDAAEASPARPGPAAAAPEAATIPVREPDSPRITRVSAALPPAESAPSLRAVAAAARAPEAAVAAAAPEAPAARSAPRKPRPPALTLAGPEGTRVLINDTLELTSPAPRGGWNLPAGLVNLMVMLPGDAQPISSSLFVAADTLYVLDLEDDGGFSVSRRAR